MGQMKNQFVFENLCKNVIQSTEKKQYLKTILDLLSSRKELSISLWKYDGIPILFLQELTKSYIILETDEFTADECSHVCVIINILQIIVHNKEIRDEMLRMQLPFYLYPFLNSSNLLQKYELLRIASLNFICAFIETEDGEIVSFFRKTEIVPLALKCMDIGSVLSKSLASRIFLFILRNKEGLEYSVQTVERFVAISMMLNMLLGQSVHVKSMEIMRNVMECYVILSTQENVRLSFASNLPKSFDNEQVLKKINENEECKALLNKFYENIKIE